MSKKTKTEISSSNVAVPSKGTLQVPLGRIIVDREFNARTQGMDEDSIKEFSDTIEREGLLQPVVVEPMEDGSFYLKAGFRRVAAYTYKLANAKTDKEKERWSSIEATVKLSDGANKKEQSLSRMLTNLVENVARNNLTPFDLANRCKVLKMEHGMTGGDIAKRLSKSTGYINNLLAVVGAGEKGERKGATLHPDILARWEEECGFPEDSKQTRFVTIDAMKKWLVMSHDEQARDFNRRLFITTKKPKDEELEAYDIANGFKKPDAPSGGGKDTPSNEPFRATKSQLDEALEAVDYYIAQAGKDKERLTRLNGIREGLKFAIGSAKGKTNGIKGIIAYKDGALTEGPPKKEEKKDEKAA